MLRDAGSIDTLKNRESGFSVVLPWQSSGMLLWKQRQQQKETVQ